MTAPCDTGLSDIQPSQRDTSQAWCNRSTPVLQTESEGAYPSACTIFERRWFNSRIPVCPIGDLGALPRCRIFFFGEVSPQLPSKQWTINSGSEVEGFESSTSCQVQYPVFSIQCSVFSVQCSVLGEGGGGKTFCSCGLNGEGAWFRPRRLQVRVLPGVLDFSIQLATAWRRRVFGRRTMQRLCGPMVEAAGSDPVRYRFDSYHRHQISERHLAAVISSA